MGAEFLLEFLESFLSDLDIVYTKQELVIIKEYSYKPVERIFGIKMGWENFHSRGEHIRNNIDTDQ